MKGSANIVEFTQVQLCLVGSYMEKGEQRRVRLALPWRDVHEDQRDFDFLKSACTQFIVLMLHVSSELHDVQPWYCRGTRPEFVGVYSAGNKIYPLH